MKITPEYAEEFKRWQAAERERKAAEEARPQPAGKQPKRQRPAGDAGRWATLNAFSRLARRCMKRADRDVWLTLFVEARGGMASVSVRQIEAETGLARRHVIASLKSLQVAGFVRATTVSKVKGVASVYWVNPNPAECFKGTDALGSKSGSLREPNPKK